MKLTRRKITLQLTPLLDLMLVVFFMQYLQLRERETLSAASVASAETSANTVREELASARQTAADATRSIDDLRNRLGHQESASRVRSAQADALESRLRDALDRQKLLGSLVVELFGISEEDVAKVLDPNPQPGLQRSPQEIEELRQRFREMASMEAPRMIRHLLVYEEIRKRADVWDLTVDGEQVLTLNTGSRSTRLKLFLDEQKNPDMARFEDDFFELYKSLPEPKSLVVILLSYDPQARLIVTEALAESLPRITRRLTADARGTIKFESAELGIRLSP